MKTLQQVSLLLSALEMNLTSSFLFSSDQLEYALHLLLPPVSLQQVSPVQLIFEMSCNPLDFVHTMVTPTFFVLLHLQDPSLQCSPLNHNRIASVTGGRTRPCTNFSKFTQNFSDRILVVFSNDSFLVFDTDLSQDSCQAQFFWAQGLRTRSLWAHNL